MKQNILVSLLCGFVGAFIFANLFKEQISIRENTITASSLRLVDSNGKVRALLAISQEGTPGFWMNDENGVARLTFGLYGDSTSYFGLQDKNGQMIELMRSFGPKEAPLLIFKHKGQDMMITGLNPGQEPVPFSMHYEADRKRIIPFGKYEGP